MIIVIFTSLLTRNSADMNSKNTQSKTGDYSTKEIRGLLIQFLATYSVRKDMCLPILLMVGQSQEKMLDLMVFMRDNDPTEHQIIQKAIVLSSE